MRRPYADLRGNLETRGRALADVLREKRRQQRHTQDSLAFASGVSLDSIRKLERYAVVNPGFFTVTDLARALSLELGDLDTQIQERLRRAK